MSLYGILAHAHNLNSLEENKNLIGKLFKTSFISYVCLGIQI